MLPATCQINEYLDGLNKMRLSDQKPTNAEVYFGLS